MAKASDESRFWTAIILALIGAFVGAPIGAALAACIAALIGALVGFVNGFARALSAENFPWGFLFASIDHIGQGAAAWAGKWTIAGAKWGPIVGAIVGFILTYVADEEESDTKTETPPEGGSNETNAS